jgi:hypothetical protein
MSVFENDRVLRHLAAALGGGVAVFGLWPVVAPRGFEQTFGLPSEVHPGVVAALRSVGVRDVVSGAGLCSAAMHGGKYAPWLLSRLLIDGGDTLVMALASRQPGSNRRMAALGALALGAALVDVTLWRAAKRAARDGGQAGHPPNY